jgi:Fic family protein
VPGILSPSFCSIEEYLGRNTPRYYDVLAQVGQGNWHPANDATPWVRFILTAHVRQVRTILRRIHDSEEIWTQLEDLAKTLGFPERSIPTLFDATLGYRIRNATYRAVAFEYDEVEISDATASRDLRRLVEVGLLRPVGEKRGRYYLATQGLAAIRQLVVAAHDPRDDTDPFATPASVQSQQPSLFGSAHAG